MITMKIASDEGQAGLRRAHYIQSGLSLTDRRELILFTCVCNSEDGEPTEAIYYYYFDSGIGPDFSRDPVI